MLNISNYLYQKQVPSSNYFQQMLGYFQYFLQPFFLGHQHQQFISYFKSGKYLSADKVSKQCFVGVFEDQFCISSVRTSSLAKGFAHGPLSLHPFSLTVPSLFTKGEERGDRERNPWVKREGTVSETLGQRRCPN